MVMALNTRRNVAGILLITRGAIDADLRYEYPMITSKHISYGISAAAHTKDC